MIYLDNAATTYPKPPAGIRAMVRGFFHYGANPGRSGYPMAMATSEQVYSCRQALAEFCRPDLVVILAGPESCRAYTLGEIFPFAFRLEK